MINKKRAILSVLVVVIFLLIGLFSVVTSAEEKITLTMWHPFGTSGHPGGGETFNKLVKEFEEKYPNIDVDATLYGVLELREKMLVSLPARTMPDIWFAGPAAATLGRFAQAGYLADLAPYYEKYKWENIVLEQGLDYVSYKGKYYGVPHNPDLVVIYYNKDMFKEKDWQVPNTYDEFIDLIKEIKAEGMSPIAFGNLDGWPGTNVISVFLDFEDGAYELYNDVLFGDGRWDIQEFENAAKHFVEFKDLGAFYKNINSVSAYDASMLFVREETPLFIQGTWQMAGIIDSAPFEAGMFLFPTNEFQKKAVCASYGPYFAISSNSKYKDAAAKFLNFIVFEKKEIWYEETMIAPALKMSLENVDFYNPLAKERAELVNKYFEKHVFDFHTAPPTSVVAYAYGGIQAMLDHQLTPEEFWKEIQKRWEREKEEGKIWNP